MAQGTPLTATLTTDRGCGGSATYQNGETIRVRYSVSQNAIVTITLTRPDGFVLRPVFQQPVPAGVTQEYVGTVGGVSGPRQLFLDATSTTGGTASVECIYFGTGGPTTPPPPPPPPPPGQLTASLITNRGCGPTAIFAKGELSEFRYQVSQSALVTLRLQRPDGTVSTLLLNQPAAGGVTYVFRGVIGDPPGQRLLTLNAVAGTLSAQVQCTYTGQSVPAPSPLSLTVDRGCGDELPGGGGSDHPLPIARQCLPDTAAAASGRDEPRGVCQPAGAGRNDVRDHRDCGNPSGTADADTAGLRFYGSGRHL
jgi:hypothetical protein